MNVLIIGAGYVGLTTAAVLAKLGHTVHCVDENEQKIAALTRGDVPIYEPGLAELLTDHKSRLFFIVTDKNIYTKPMSYLFASAHRPTTTENRTCHTSTVPSLRFFLIYATNKRSS
ncbi:UDP-glucose 6-dehydrogenase YwqF [Anoxybacillus sp. BCO1]|nr:UDP-glucose 6-dehydrogenase YwqF [Anoxybacillus sp. BCO1]